MLRRHPRRRSDHDRSASRSISFSIRSSRSLSFSVESFSRKRSTISGSANGLGTASSHEDDALLAHALQHLAQALDVELLAQHLALGLAEQQVAGVVLAEDLVEQRARRLQLARRSSAAPGKPWLISPETRAISRKRRRASSLELRLASTSCSRSPSSNRLWSTQRRRVDRPRREQLEAVVVDDDREGVRRVLREPPGEQAAEADVRVAAGERIEEQVLALARLEPLDQQRLRRRDARELHLRLEHRPRRLQLGVEEVALGGVGEHLQHRVGELARERHLGAGPGDHERLLAVGAPARRRSSPRRARTRACGRRRRSSRPSSGARRSPPRPRRCGRRERYFTCIDESLTMVPTLSLWRRAIARFGTR